MRHETDEKSVQNLFEAVGFKIEKIWMLQNRYGGTYLPNFADKYYSKESRAEQALFYILQPWWLVKTEYGLIEYGPRKRVFQIDWSETAYRGKLDLSYEMSQGDDYIHSYCLDDDFRFLRLLKEKLKGMKNE